MDVVTIVEREARKDSESGISCLTGVRWTRLVVTVVNVYDFFALYDFRQS